jgi:hypothetical protein
MSRGGFGSARMGAESSRGAGGERRSSAYGRADTSPGWHSLGARGGSAMARAGSPSGMGRFGGGAVAMRSSVADGQWHSFGGARGSGGTNVANARFGGSADFGRGGFGGRDFVGRGWGGGWGGGGFGWRGGWGYPGYGFGWGCWSCGWGFGFGWGIGWNPYWAVYPYPYWDNLWWGDPYGYYSNPGDIYPYAG